MALSWEVGGGGSSTIETEEYISYPISLDGSGFCRCCFYYNSLDIGCVLGLALRLLNTKIKIRVLWEDEPHNIFIYTPGTYYVSRYALCCYFVIARVLFLCYRVSWTEDLPRHLWVRCGSNIFGWDVDPLHLGQMCTQHIWVRRLPNISWYPQDYWVRYVPNIFWVIWVGCVPKIFGWYVYPISMGQMCTQHLWVRCVPNIFWVRCVPNIFWVRCVPNIFWVRCVLLLLGQMFAFAIPGIILEISMAHTIGCPA